MKKRLITVLFIVSVLGLVGCGNTSSSNLEDKVQDAMETEVEQEHTEVDEAVDSKVDYMAFQGEYQDRISQRATAIVKENADQDSINIEVRWSSSATECDVWLMDAAFESGNDEKLVYTNCQHLVETYKDDSDEPESVVDYIEESGSFDVTYESDHYVLKWTGALEDNCKTCEFVKMDADYINDTEDNSDSNVDKDANHVAETEKVSDTGADLYMDLANCMATMYDVRPGTAGTSLRAEAAAEELANLIKNYNGKVSKADICENAKEWVEVMKEDQPTVREDFTECLEEVLYYVEDEFKDVAKDAAYQDFADGLREAVQ